jgi:hypothetical protein
MTISLRGRRSGGEFRFPVGYHDQRDAVLVMVSEAKARQWWRNFQTPWPASLRIRGQARKVIGEVLEPGSAEFGSRMARSFRRAAFIPRIFDVDFDPARGLTAEQTTALGESMAAVRFRPSEATDDGDFKGESS